MSAKALFNLKTKGFILSILLLTQFVVAIHWAPSSSALTVGSGNCILTVDTTTAVSVTSSGGNCVATFSYLGATNIWTVPATGLTNVSFTIKGSKGGGSTPDAGLGASFSGLIPTLSASTQLYINVGGAGLQNGNGGFGGSAGGNVGSNNGAYGGGGSTDVRVGSNTSAARVLVAGGGGGAGGANVTVSNGSNASGPTGGAGKLTATCSGSSGQDASAGGAGGNSINCRNAGAGGGGYAGGGGAGNPTGGDNAQGGSGGKGSSYWDSSFASITSDCGSGCSFWNNGTSNTNTDYSRYINSTNGSLILIFLPVTTARITNLSVAGPLTYRLATTITVSLVMPAYVTFRARGRSIAGCVRQLAISSGNSYVATCSYRPTVHGGVELSAIAYPVDNSFGNGLSSNITFGVITRGGNR